MRIFLSARYERRLELCGYREELVAMGHTVTSRWLDGAELMLPFGGKLGQSYVDAIENDTLPAGGALRSRLATIDIKDIMAAECFVSFTEPRGSDTSRGGRHVEFGFMLGGLAAVNKQVLRANEKDGAVQHVARARCGYGPPARIIVVGHRENLFDWLPEIEFAETWEKAKDLLVRKE